MFKNKKQKTISTFVFLIYIILLVWLVLFKFSVNLNNLPDLRYINLIPFKESFYSYGIINHNELIYNILIFIPFGVYLNVLKNNFSLKDKIQLSICFSLSFEIIQYICSIGVSDITDILTNTLGSLLGILLYKVLIKLFKNKTISIINIIGTIIEIIAILLIMLLVVNQ